VLFCVFITQRVLLCCSVRSLHKHRMYQIRNNLSQGHQLLYKHLYIKYSIRNKISSADSYVSYVLFQSGLRKCLIDLEVEFDSSRDEDLNLCVSV